MADETTAGRDEFLRDDYHLKVDYLKDQFTRMWNRFQFMLGLETAVAGLYFVPLGTGGVARALAFSVLGLIVSLGWWVMGAEDRFLVVLYRDQVKEAAEKAAATVGITRPVYVGDESHAERRRQNPIEWRREWISITRLPAIFALVAIALWVGLLVLAILRIV